MCAVVAHGPSGMCLVQRPILQDLFVGGAAGDEHKPLYASASRCFDQLQAAKDILLDKWEQISHAAAATRPRMIERRVDDRLAAGDQLPASTLVAELTRKPLQVAGEV